MYFDIENILQGSSCEVQEKLIKRFENIKIPKLYMANFLIKQFANYYINKNLENLTIFYKLICNLYLVRSKGDVISTVNDCIMFFSKIGKKKVNLTKIDYDENVIDSIVASLDREPDILEEIKDKTATKIYSLLCFTQNAIVSGENLQDTIVCVLYMLNLPMKDQRIKGTKDTVVDYIWMMMTRFCHKTSSDMFKFVRICKELYYYKLTNGIRSDRCNLVLFSLLVVIQRDVRIEKTNFQDSCSCVKKVEGKTKIQNADNVANSWDYLYIVLDYDWDTINRVVHEKDVRSRFDYDKHMTKTINGDKLGLLVNKNPVDIVKISH